MLILCEEKGGDRMNLFFVFLGTAAWQDLRTRSISLEVLAGGSRDHNLHMEGTASGGDRSGDDSWNYAFADWNVDKGAPG